MRRKHVPSALVVRCPVCQAEVNHPCLRPDGSEMLHSHTERAAAARWILTPSQVADLTKYASNPHAAVQPQRRKWFVENGYLRYAESRGPASEGRPFTRSRPRGCELTDKGRSACEQAGKAEP